MQSDNIKDILEPIRLTPNVAKLIKNKPAPAHIPHLPLTLTNSPRQRLLKLTKIQLKKEFRSQYENMGGLYRIEGAGHWVHFDRKEAFLDALY